MSLTDQEMDELTGLEGREEFTDADLSRMDALYAKADQLEEAPDPNVMEEAAQASLPQVPASIPPATMSQGPAMEPPPDDSPSRLDSLILTRDGVKVRFQAPWMKEPTSWDIKKPGLIEPGFENASNFVNQVMTPAVIDPLQEAARFGVDVGPFKTPAAEDDAKKINKTFGPAAEYLYRAGMQLFAGRGFLEEMDERERLDAINSVERITSNPLLRKFLPSMAALPGVGLPAMALTAADALAPETTAGVLAAAPAALAETVGQAPLMFVGVGKGGAIATRAAGILPMVKRAITTTGAAAVHGAAGNVLFAALQGSKKPVGQVEFDEQGKPIDTRDMGEEALLGALFGVGFHAAVQVPKVIAFTRAAAEDFAKVMFDAGERGEAILRGALQSGLETPAGPAGSIATQLHTQSARLGGGDATKGWMRTAAVRDTRTDPVRSVVAASTAAEASAAGKLPKVQPARGPKGNPRVDIEPTAAIVGLDEKGNLVAHLWEITAKDRRLTRVGLDGKRVTQWVGARLRVSGVAPMLTHDAMVALESKGLKPHLFPPTTQAHGPGDVLETVVDREAYARIMRSTAETRVEGPNLPKENQPSTWDEAAVLGPADLIHLHEDGTWTSNRLATKEERAASMRVHRLASTIDENGARRYGYLMHSQADGMTWLAPPHPDEEISGALMSARVVKPGEWKLAEGRELLAIAEHVPSSVAIFQARHDPRITNAESLLTTSTRFLHSTGLLKRKAALQRALKTSPHKRPEELSRELQGALRSLAEGVGLKRPEAEVVLRHLVGAAKPSPQGLKEIDAIARAMQARSVTEGGVVPPFLREAAPEVPAGAELVGPENYPGPENIPESGVAIRKPEMLPGVMKGMKLTGPAQEMGAPPPPPDIVHRELGATKSLHEARQRAGAPEAPEQTAARLLRGQVEGAFAEWHGRAGAPPPVVRLTDGSLVEVVGHESEGALTVRDATGARQVRMSDVAEFVGDAPTRKRMFQTAEEVRQALATVQDAAVPPEKKAVLRGDTIAAARKDGFTDEAIAKALDDAEKMPRTSSGLIYGAEGAPPERPAPVGGSGRGSGLPPDDLPPVSYAPEDPPQRVPPELIPPQDAAMAGFLAKMGKALTNPVLWRNRNIAAAAAQSQSEQSLNRVLSTAWEKRWTKLFGSKNDTVALRQDVMRVAKSEMSMDELGAKYPFVTQLRREFLQKALLKRSINDQRIRQLGLVSGLEASMGEDALEEYLTREFFRFMWEPGEWARFVKQHDRPRMEKALKYFEESIKDSEVIGGEGLDRPTLLKLKRAQAARYVDAIMGDPAFAEFDPFKKGSGKMPSALQSLKHRRLDEHLKALEAEAAEAKGALPKELQDALAKERKHVEVIKSLLGESTDGMTALGTTLARQEVLIKRGEMMRDLSQVRELVSPYAGQQTTDGRWFVEVPPDRNSWGMLSGKFIHPDLHEALTWAAGTEEIAKGWMSLPWRLFKANILLPIVGGFSPVMHNMVGDLAFGIMSGGLDVTGNPLRVKRALVQAAKSTHAMSSPEKFLTPDAELYQRAVSYGMISPGYAELELTGQTMKSLMQLEADPRARVWDFITIASAPWRVAKKGVGILSTAYDAPSKLFKFAAWIGNRERILSSPKKYLGERYAPGMSDDILQRHVDALAAKWINESFPNFDRIGRWQEAIRSNGPAGAAVPTFATEDIRIHAMMPMRLARSGKALVTGNVSDGADPDLALRVMRWGLLTATLGGMYAAKRRANGISDADVEEAIRATPDYVQGHGLGLFADMERDENGKIVIRDYSAFIAPLRYTYGRDDASWSTRIAWNLVKTPIAGGPYDAPMVRIFGEPLGIEDAMGGEAKAWQKHGAGYIDTLLRTPLAPQGAQRFFSPAYRAGAMGDPSPSTIKLTPLQGITHAMGLPTYPIGSGEIGQAKLNAVRDVKRAAKDITSAARQQRGGPATQAVKALGGPTVRQQAVDSAMEEYKRTLNRRFPKEKPQ